MKSKFVFTALLLGHVFGILTLSAQTIYVPGGTVGNNSANSNVGIGTSTPSSKLFINSAGAGGVGDADLGLHLTISSLAPNIHLVDTSASVDSYFVHLNQNVLKLGRSAGTSIQNDLVMNGGNVGIGRLPSGFRLDLTAPDNTGSNASVMRLSVSNGDVPVVFQQESEGSTWTLGLADGYPPNPQESFVLSRGGTLQAGPKLVVQTNGNIGIGTTSPSHLLSVNGTIRAKEVIVDTGWSDYVFEDDYRLAPLEEVEAHIREKKHLPGIPSADEVAREGISLGIMQAKLLAKVEELTLHMIELKKENTTLRQEVEILKRAGP